MNYMARSKVAGLMWSCCRFELFTLEGEEKKCTEAADTSMRPDIVPWIVSNALRNA